MRQGGRVYAGDDIVFATGLDAMTGALTRVDIRGCNLAICLRIGEGSLATRLRGAIRPRRRSGLHRNSASTNTELAYVTSCFIVVIHN